MSGPVDLSLEVLQRARFSRDPRFDGKFFIAVASSRIYCRPICPVSFARVVRFYATAAEAEAAGYRPCLRCRPEAAPGSPAWRGTSATVSRALRLIEEGALDTGTVTDLAARVGVGARHLGRLMVAQVGASPLAIAQTRRLHFAKLLLSDTMMPITDIALACGYGSVRRFNDAFKTSYRRPPSDIRRRAPSSEAACKALSLRLAYRPPFDWADALKFLSGEAVARVEAVRDGAYVRALAGANGPLLIEMSDDPSARALEMKVSGASPADLFRLATLARQVFDLAADPMRVAAAFAGDALIGPLIAAKPGRRLVGVWSGFEAAVRAILAFEPGGGALDRRLANEIAERFGQPVAFGYDDLTRLFPSPASLAEADLEACGLDRPRAACLQALARAACVGRLPLEDATSSAIADLACQIGFGETRAQWVALRGHGDPDAFPAPAALAGRAEAWRPWRGYALFHLMRAGALAATAANPASPGDEFIDAAGRRSWQAAGAAAFG